MKTLVHPSKGELQAAYGRRVQDIIRHHLKILFVGINPSLYSAVVGHHFSRPGNRFWPVLYRAGLTPRQLDPKDECRLFDYGIGITNIVNRATARANELSGRQILAGAVRLKTKVKRYQPRVLAVLGIGAYQIAFAEKKVKIGEQAKSLGKTKVWVLPNPSGLNANYQLIDLTRLYRQLRRAAFD
jgi:double-stranded uracil-DNA glycosylase